MKLHTVFVTHNRIELTKQAVASYLEAVTLPYSYIVIDNASTDGTQTWIAEAGHPHWNLFTNLYPGAACNLGWREAPSDATLLQRADNDFMFLPGWCDDVVEAFQNPRLGQLGLRPWVEEPVSVNVGGNNIIRRHLFDRGLRYDETPWPEFKPAYTEDTYFSPKVRRMGYRVEKVKRHIIQDLSVPTASDPYYVRSYTDRGIAHRLPA